MRRNNSTKGARNSRNQANKTGKKNNYKPVRQNGRTKQIRREQEDVNGDLKDLRLSKSNPYSWYAKFPNFAKDVATLPFGVPVGQPIYVNGNDYIANAGIMALHFVPSPGKSVDLTSPINRQATRFYSFLRSVQRAAANYDSADVMMYLMGIDSLYTYWAHLRRIYGVAQLFSPTNKYYPRRILQTLGVDPDDILSNLADFRAFINRFALNIGRFAMPKNFDITQRHMWMASGLYLDSNTTKAQTYVFVPSAFWQWDNTVSTGSQLVCTRYDASYSGGTPSTPVQHSVADLIAFGQSLINNFDNDEDTMNISGDLLRAYGQENLLAVEETTDGYAILPVYDQTVLSQIENAVICGRITHSLDSSTLPLEPAVIAQNPAVNNGAIIFNPQSPGGTTQIGNTYWKNFALTNPQSLMNMHWDSPTPEQVMEASRLMAFSTGLIATATATHLNLTDFGTDIIEYVRVCITSLSNANAVQFILATTQTLYIGTDVTQTQLQNNIDLLAVWEQFDWSPMLYVYDVTNGLRLMGADIDNFTVVKHDQLYNIHEAALLSVLDVPEFVAK